MNINEIDWQQVRLNICAFEQKAMNPELELQYFSEKKTNWEYSEKNTPYNFITNDIMTLKYRIKPEPQYRPYTEVKEEWIGKKVKYKRGTAISIITGIERYMVYVGNFSHNLKCMFEEYIWGNNGDSNDGKPFGEVIE